MEKNQIKKRKSFYLNYEDEKVFLIFLENAISKNNFDILLSKCKFMSGSYLDNDRQELNRRINTLEKEQEVLINIRNSFDKKYL